MQTLICFVFFLYIIIDLPEALHKNYPFGSLQMMSLRRQLHDNNFTLETKY